MRLTDIATAEPTGAVTGGVRTLLRLEGLALFAGMTLLYWVWDGSWWVYAVLFLAPDLSFLAYLFGPRFGAMLYNAAHTYMVPMALMTLGFATAEPLVLSIAMIWLAHIGFDRALGYGLKYDSGFGFTHLGRIGKKSTANEASASSAASSFETASSLSSDAPSRHPLAPPAAASLRSHESETLVPHGEERGAAARLEP
jgi:hypothetical protein